jgi:hypothetical protein
MTSSFERPDIWTQAYLAVLRGGLANEEGSIYGHAVPTLKIPRGHLVPTLPLPPLLYRLTKATNAST